MQTFILKGFLLINKYHLFRLITITVHTPFITARIKIHISHVLAIYPTLQNNLTICYHIQISIPT